MVLENLIASITGMSIIYKLIWIILALLFSGFILHISAKLLGFRRGYETAFGVVFLFWISTILIGWLLGLISVILSATVSLILSLVIWVFLVRRYYNTTIIMGLVTLVINILVLVLINLLVAFIVAVFSGLFF